MGRNATMTATIFDFKTRKKRPPPLPKFRRVAKVTPGQAVDACIKGDVIEVSTRKFTVTAYWKRSADQKTWLSHVSGDTTWTRMYAIFTPRVDDMYYIVEQVKDLDE
jgi:hypothetical protein